MSARHSLIDLPLEVLHQVFVCLDTLHDRLQLSQACRLLHQLFSESPTLQYELQLTVADQLDVPNGERPRQPGDPIEISTYKAKSKLELLKGREEAWRTLSYRAKSELVIDGAAGVYELQDSIFLMCDGYEPPMSHNGRPTVIRLLPLPGADDEQLHRQRPPIESKKLDFQIADLTMDPTQDLIVVSEHNPIVTQTANEPVVSNRYHLLSLSTFESHPLASFPVLDFPPSARRPVQTRQLLQVMGDTLVIMVSRFTANWMMAMAGEIQIGNMMLGPEIQEELVCWNWKTGKVMARRGLKSTNFFTSLAVLSPNSFLITCTESQPPTIDTEVDARDYPPVIELYHIPSADGPGSDVPLGLENEDTTTPRPKCLMRLGLPRFRSGVTINAFEVRPDPPFLPLRADQPAHFGARKPFTQDPECGVLVFDLSVQEPDRNLNFGNFGIPLPLHHGGRTLSFELFILREFMNGLVTEAMWDIDEQTGLTREWSSAEVVEWQDWGELNSRMNPTSMIRRNWVCSCSGHRFVSLWPDTPRPHQTNPDADSESDSAPDVLNPKRRVRMMDFSPYNISRHFLENRDKAPDSVPKFEEPEAGPSRTRDSILDQLLAVVDGDDEMMTEDEESGNESQDYQSAVEEMLLNQQVDDSSEQEEMDEQHGEAWAADEEFGAEALPAGLFDEDDDQDIANQDGSDHQNAQAWGWSDDGSASMQADHDTTEPEDDFVDVSIVPMAPQFGRCQAIIKPSVLIHNNIWYEPVRSQLPYRLVELEEEFRANGVMIDEERVMVVHTKKRLLPDGELRTTQTLTILTM